MKNNAKKTFTQIATVAAFFLAISVANPADAQTYFIDTTGNGCNASCQQLLSQYFSSNTNTTNTTNTTNNTNSTSTNGTSTATTTTPTTTTNQPVTYPYQQYTYFPSTISYYNAGRATTSQVQSYPYQAYTYFNNPGPSTVNTQTYSYPNQFYTYYGSDANEQLRQYQQGSSGTGTNRYQTGNQVQSGTNRPQNTGFTMTSGF